MKTSNNFPQISVIIPYYNPPFDYFKEAIESVLSQSYSHWEAIIVNDGSSLQSKNNLAKFIGSLNENRIFVINLDGNYGPSVARNKGIEASRGEIITFLDADDLHLPWQYEEAIEYFNETSQCSIVLGYNVHYVALGPIKKLCPSKIYISLLEGKEKPESILEKIKQAKISITPRFYFKKEILGELTFNPEIQIGEDLDLLLRILNNNKFLNKVAIAPQSGYLHRFYPSKSRLTHKFTKYQAMTDLVDTYRDSFLAGKTVRLWQNTHSEWMFSKLLSNYLIDGSIFKYLKDAFSNFHSVKDKMESIRVLINVVLVKRFLMPVLGIDLRYLTFLFAWKNNKYKIFKRKSKDHLETITNRQAKFYANKVLKRIF